MKLSILSLSLFTLISMCAMNDVNSQKDFITNKVIAHRGAWKAKNLPQNSIASLKEAISLGCEGSEFDVWMTVDSILVVNHDPDFYGLPIETSTYQELLHKKHPNGEQISTVEAYLQEGMKQSRTKLIMEIKPSEVSGERGLTIAKKAVEMVHHLGAEDWVDYIGFDYNMCLKIIELDPKANVAYLEGDKSPNELAEAGFFGLDYHHSLLKQNPNWIEVANELGLTVNAWTVNKKEDMEWLLTKGARFITTDEPELLLELIKNGHK
jgi:glycerophosphoryl diester phosphodiesterase